MNDRPSDDRPFVEHLARLVLAAFLLTFVMARILVLLIMTHRIPDLYMHVRGTHIHHLNYGIFLLSGVGASLLFLRPKGRAEDFCAIVYGIGLGLTFDEFGMWLHLGGPYWQRSSIDAVFVIAALLGLFAVGPSIKEYKTRHWTTLLVIFALIGALGLLSAHVWGIDGSGIEAKIKKIEEESPP